MGVTAYIGLGANLGDREANIRRALDVLDADPRVTITRRSSLIETDPVGGPAGQPRFFNGVAELATELSPQDLAALLHAIETQLGRQRRGPNAPRTIDLDLLLYDDLCLETDALTIPHPRMHERRFVLAPLAEIAPSARHPICDRTAREMLAMVEESRHPQTMRDKPRRGERQ